MPEVDAQLRELLSRLERHFGDLQDTEFTVEEGRLYMLQARSAKRPAQAAVRFAVDGVDEGLLSPAQAVATIGICGEHGGDPDSIRFCHTAGLDYVSCSPFRVPIARVAAAQAATLD